jgi:hypothetical protein
MNNAHLYTSIAAMCSKRAYTHQLICGDFNMPGVDWDTWTAHGEQAHNLVETLRDCYLFQHLDQPTRLRGTDNPSLLDLVLTNEENMLSETSYLAPLGNSDHAVITFNYHCYLDPGRERVLRYQFHKGNYRQMKSDLNLEWGELLGDCPDDPERQLSILSDVLLKSQDQNIPRRDITKASTTRRTPLDAVIRAEIRRKHRLWERFMTARTEERRRAYTRQRNRVRKLTREAKKRYEVGLAESVKDNPKCFWRYAKSKLKTKEGVADLDVARDDGTEMKASTNKEKASALSDYFSSVYVQEPADQVPDFKTHEVPHPFTEGEITPEQVCKRLKALDPTKSQGPDGINPHVLKELAEDLAVPLSHIFNTSLRTGVVPTAWKTANVSPNFKKGQRSAPSNYRPVSLTSVVCKVMEGFIRDWLMQHLRTNNILSDKQFGFVRGRSTSIQLLQVFEHWTSVMDSGGEIDVIYLDFAKAFDTVPHRRLLKKLECQGVGGDTLRWIESFLTDRQQRVLVNNVPSEPKQVTSGVPQGSVIGPSLFVSFINDYPECLADLIDGVRTIPPNVRNLPMSTQSYMALFADDTKVYRVIKSIADRLLLQHDLRCMDEWSHQSLLKLQPPKCKAMTVSNRGEAENAHTYTLEGHAMERTKEEKDIGVTVDNKLTFDTHIANQVNKANKVMGIIRRSYTHLDAYNFKLLFKALVRPHLEYAHAVWNPHLRRHIDALENV